MGEYLQGIERAGCGCVIYWGVSVGYRKNKLWMRNFTEEYLQGMENMECRCKICGGSILKL